MEDKQKKEGLTDKAGPSASKKTLAKKEQGPLYEVITLQRNTTTGQILKKPVIITGLGHFSLTGKVEEIGGVTYTPPTQEEMARLYAVDSLRKFIRKIR